MTVLTHVSWLRVGATMEVRNPRTWDMLQKQSAGAFVNRGPFSFHIATVVRHYTFRMLTWSATIVVIQIPVRKIRDDHGAIHLIQM